MISTHEHQPVATQGRPLEEAKGAMVLLHGRGASAASILNLGDVLKHEGLAYLAPQAANYTWYPHRFIAPIKENEPFLSSALQRLNQVVASVEQAGIRSEKIILGGFSQGACLVSEFAARNPKRYGALLVFSGGLIGAPGELYPYSGDMKQTPVFLGCSDVDAHIPLERVNESADILAGLGAQVTKKIYKGMGHTINADELDEAQKLVELAMK